MISEEFRIVYRGVGDRLFIVNKPYGWNVATKGSNKLSSIIKVKLGIDNEIKFPSKLSTHQSGLVIGCTDDSMYNIINNYIHNKKCIKTYKCLVYNDIKRPRFANSGGHKLDNTISFNICKCPSTLSLRSINNDQVGDYKLCNINSTKSQFISSSSRIYIVSGNDHKLKYRILNFNDYISTLVESYNIRISKDTNDVIKELKLLELELDDHTVDVNLIDTLTSLGFKVFNNHNHPFTFNRHLNTFINSHPCLDLFKIQLPHPVYHDNVITAESQSLPFHWIKLLGKDINVII